MELSYALAALLPPSLYGYDHVQAYSTGGGLSSAGFILGFVLPLCAIPLLRAEPVRKGFVAVCMLVAFSPVPFAFYQVLAAWNG